MAGSAFFLSGPVHWSLWVSEALRQEYDSRTSRIPDEAPELKFGRRKCSVVGIFEVIFRRPRQETFPCPLGAELQTLRCLLERNRADFRVAISRFRPSQERREACASSSAAVPGPSAWLRNCICGSRGFSLGWTRSGGSLGGWTCFGRRSAGWAAATRPRNGSQKSVRNCVTLCGLPWKVPRRCAAASPAPRTSEGVRGGKTNLVGRQLATGGFHRAAIPESRAKLPGLDPGGEYGHDARWRSSHAPGGAISPPTPRGGSASPSPARLPTKAGRFACRSASPQ